MAGLYFSAETVLDGSSSVGEFVSVNTYMVNLFTPLYFLGTVYNIIIQVMYYTKRSIEVVLNIYNIIIKGHKLYWKQYRIVLHVLMLSYRSQIILETV